MSLTPAERLAVLGLDAIAGESVIDPTPAALTVSELAICLMLARHFSVSFLGVLSAFQDAKNDVRTRLQGGL